MIIVLAVDQLEKLITGTRLAEVSDPALLRRLRRYLPRLHGLFWHLYGQRPDAKEQFTGFIDVLATSYLQRRPPLLELDVDREANPCWFLSEQMMGMSLYVSRFSTDFAGFHDKIPYLKELGVNYLHFMPLWRTREGNNDGGYAVSDYRQTNFSLGTIDQFEALVTELREEGFSVCVDFILNHTAKEHRWAQRAWDGEEKYQDMYFMYDSYETPAKFEKTVPEVFPIVAPGNFTFYEEIGKWVFTSFYEFQWDLNYHNPFVLTQMVETFLFMANVGVDVIRLDAIPFLWKELGTNCRNLPQVHTITQLFWLAGRIVAPGVALLGEAIVSPEDIFSYFGTAQQRECDLLYNATRMVHLWDALATKDVRVLSRHMKEFPKPPKGAGWINYVRCHDDIGWGFNETVVAELGRDPYAHRQFLINFYRGNLPFSFARGELYESDPMTGDARNSGTLASLCGLEMALDKRDEYQAELAVKRILLMHAMFMVDNGIPVLFMGDELGLLNDWEPLLGDESLGDSRWIHRPYMDWAKAENRMDVSTSEGRVFWGLQRLIQARKDEPLFNGTVEVVPIDTGNNHVFGCYKRQANRGMVLLGNFSQLEQEVNSNFIRGHYFGGNLEDLIQGKVVDLTDDRVVLGPYEFLWLKQKTFYSRNFLP